ncbi:fascin domain-containing protein [Sinomicrobium weinanense]|uniref:RICIN domain-containing protein n=1 Tax=Sinomicrobium weinanense TaxID=2842200 RepID=A0A926JTN8_9FLAO|nr:RICIN domain-containing protein [Sinomicrobium weinanense]MBC9797176.1 RICIN domain-containing protein [Sinomicrobium weinanense]MBU3125848.1 RICIN domain-containing protein [Sinomicrobium weinanense]
MKKMNPIKLMLASAALASLASCTGMSDEPEGPMVAEYALGMVETDTFLIESEKVKQKITRWGHDIKQGRKARNLTVEACKQLFENGRYNLLRIPIYSNAHNPDGTVREDYLTGLLPTTNSTDNVQWETVHTEGDWFYLKNKAYNKYVRGLNTDAVEIDAVSYTGSWTQWKLVDAGEGWYHIQSKGHPNKHLRGDHQGNITLVNNTNSIGTWTQWKLVDAGNGYHYILNRGQNKYLSGGGNEYDLIIDAINRAKNNGDPDLYASHKIYDNSDHSTDRNANFGPFYTENGIDIRGFSASIDAFMDYIETHTGKTVKYLAPRCELGAHWTPADFIDIVNSLNISPLIVSPEAAYAINGDKFWTSGVQEVTDIKSTHNKENSPQWPLNSKYDWDGETVGGNQENFIKLFFKLHEAFYKGEVTGIVFWGDPHLNNTDDDDNNGPFRRELVAASEYNLLGCSIAKDEDASVIAFATGDENKIKVFYASMKPVYLNFDRNIADSGFPNGTMNKAATSFVMPPTGETHYRSFIVEFDE